MTGPCPCPRCTLFRKYLAESEPAPRLPTGRTVIKNVNEEEFDAMLRRYRGPWPYNAADWLLAIFITSATYGGLFLLFLR